MTDRLTPGQLRDLADIYARNDYPGAAELLSQEAARREAEAFVPEAARQAAARSAGLTSAPPLPDAPPPTAPDLVERLRAFSMIDRHPERTLHHEAADAIEALRAERDVAQKKSAGQEMVIDHLLELIDAKPHDETIRNNRAEAAEARAQEAATEGLRTVAKWRECEAREAALRGALERIAKTPSPIANTDAECLMVGIARNALAGGKHD